MECRLLHGYDLDFSPNKWWWKFGPALNLLLLLLPLRSLRISGLLARSHSEPLGQLLGGALRELGELLLPHRLKPLGADHLGAALVQLLAVAVAPCVRPPLVLGEHPDGGRVLLGERLGVETLLDRLVPLLQLLPLRELLQLVILIKLPLLIVVLVCLELENRVPDLLSLGLQLVRVHGIKVEGLDADPQRDLHLLLHLLLGLGHLLASVHRRTRGLLASLLLGGHHLLPLDLRLLHGLLLLLLLSRLLGSLGLLPLVLLLLLLRSKLSVLLGADLLPRRLLVLQTLQLGLLLGPLLSPLVDVVFQLLVQLVLLDSLFPLCKCLIPLHGGVRHCFIFVVRHFGGFSLSGPLSSQGRILAPLVK